MVGYADEGYSLVSYPVVGYGFVGVTYRYVGEGYWCVGYGGVWRSEMWRRTHRWGLTRGVAVDRMEVQQRGKRERKPQWTSKSTSSKSSAATTPQTWQTSWKTSKADPKAPAPAGAFPCPQTRPEWPEKAPPERRRRPRLGHPAGGAPQALRAAISKPEGAPPKAGGVRGGPGDGPEQLRNVGVAKIPELKM